MVGIDSIPPLSRGLSQYPGIQQCPDRLRRSRLGRFDGIHHAGQSYDRSPGQGIEQADRGNGRPVGIEHTLAIFAQ